MYKFRGIYVLDSKRSFIGARYLLLYTFGYLCKGHNYHKFNINIRIPLRWAWYYQVVQQVIFATGNNEKFLTAQQACQKAHIQLLQRDVETVEIQSEDPKAVALDKAQKAFATIQKPVVITDDSWNFIALNGFPGVYMHSMNKWFTADDYLRLMRGVEDRRCLLTQYLIYCDQNGMKVFTKTWQGGLLEEARGRSKHASHEIIAMDGDNGLTIAEVYEQVSDTSNSPTAHIWHEFAAWVTSSK